MAMAMLMEATVPTSHRWIPKAMKVQYLQKATTSLNEKSALLDVAHHNARDRQIADEAEGFKFLFMGTTQGLRNPRAHGAHLQTDEQGAMEMLATASLLMRALDRAEKRIPPKPAQ